MSLVPDAASSAMASGLPLCRFLLGSKPAPATEVQAEVLLGSKPAHVQAEVCLDSKQAPVAAEVLLGSKPAPVAQVQAESPTSNAHAGEPLPNVLRG